VASKATSGGSIPSFPVLNLLVIVLMLFSQHYIVLTVVDFLFPIKEFFLAPNSFATRIAALP
jgi:hypothetical protein